MQIVLLSGGSGKRLWPLSNEVRSKAFLRLLPDDSGGLESMVERVCRGLAGAGLLDSCCIVTHLSQVEITRNHTGENVPVIAEPLKKGTFTAAVLAASYLHSVRHMDPDEIVTVIPVDSFVEPLFFERIARFPAVLEASGADVALLGAQPKSPSTQFGYIVPRPSPVPEDEADGGTAEAVYLEVAQFAEKPDETRARRFMEEGGLWNCGVFSCRLRFLLARAAEKGMSAGYEELLGSYGSLPERSFDVEVLERTRRAVVVPYTGMWEDIGSWDALTPHLQGRVTGSGSLSLDSEGSYLINELPCPVHVLGVPEVVVAAGPDGILVAGRDQAKRIKDTLGREAARPMIEERRWGMSRILDRTVAGDGSEATVFRLSLLPGKHTSYHLHFKTREMWTILSGSGEYRLNGVVRRASPGDCITVAPGVKHALRAVTAMELILVEIRIQPEGDDLVRISSGWEVPPAH